LADTLQDVWTQRSQRKGIAKIEPFDREHHLEGVTYQSKQEFDSNGNELWLSEDFSPALQRLFRENVALSMAA